MPNNEMPFSHFRVSGVGVGSRINVTTSSASLTLPLREDGQFPNFCRVMVEPNASGNGAFCYVNVGMTSAVTAQAGNILVTSNEQVILHTRGFQYIATFHPSTTCNMNIIPLENC